DGMREAPGLTTRGLPKERERSRPEVPSHAMQDALPTRKEYQHDDEHGSPEARNPVGQQGSSRLPPGPEQDAPRQLPGVPPARTPAHRMRMPRAGEALPRLLRRDDGHRAAPAHVLQ